MRRCNFLKAFNLYFNFNLIVHFPLEVTTIGSFAYLFTLFFTFFTLDGLLSFLPFAFFCVNGITLFMAIFYYIYFLSVLLPIAMAQLETFLIKLRQITASLRKPSHRFTSIDFAYLKKHHLAVLSPFLDYNRLYGQIFLFFLLINVPINVFFVVTLLVPGDMSPLGQIYIVLYASLQMVCLFLMHLYLIDFSKLFHRPGDFLCCIYARRATKKGNLRVRLQLADSTQALHTTRRIGLTYGQFGLVTMRSFITFLLLYGKFLMTVYRMSKL